MVELDRSEPAVSVPVALRPFFGVAPTEEKQLHIQLASTGGEPLVPHGEALVSAGQSIVDAHLRCFQRCKADGKVSKSMTKADGTKLCFQHCYRIAAYFYAPQKSDGNSESNEAANVYGAGTPWVGYFSARSDDTSGAPLPSASSLLNADDAVMYSRDAGPRNPLSAAMRLGMTMEHPQPHASSWESAMRYMFDAQPPMAPSVGNGELVLSSQ